MKYGIYAIPGAERQSAADELVRAAPAGGAHTLAASRDELGKDWLQVRGTRGAVCACRGQEAVGGGLGGDYNAFMLGRLETERLLLREVELADAPWFFALNQDPEVMRYPGGVPAGDDVEKTRDLLTRRLATYSSCPGLGLGTCCLRASDEFIGWFMLRPRSYQKYHPSGALLPLTQHVELGYRLARRHWGQGYATEMSTALVHYGFEQLALTEIVAFVLPEHHASIRVLHKAGLRRAGRAREHGEDADVYRVDRAAICLD